MTGKTVQRSIRQLADQIIKADAIVIGGGSGLSAAAGYDHYHWSAALSNALSDFREHYGFRSPWDGFYYCFSSYEEQWGYYSRYIRFMQEAPVGKPYLDLKEIVKGKPVFVLTTNADGQFFRVFPRENVCAFQGDFSFCQCSQPCRDEVIPNGEMIQEMTEHLDGVRIPAELVPRCPECGRVLVPWVRDDAFLEGKVWKDSVERYHRFLRQWLLEQRGKHLLLLELGVGEMTPAVIKLPFWEMTAKNPGAFYACLNQKESSAPAHLKDKSLYISGDLAEVLPLLGEALREKAGSHNKKQED